MRIMVFVFGVGGSVRKPVLVWTMSGADVQDTM